MQCSCRCYTLFFTFFTINQSISSPLLQALDFASFSAIVVAIPSIVMQCSYRIQISPCNDGLARSQPMQGDVTFHGRKSCFNINTIDELDCVMGQLYNHKCITLSDEAAYNWISLYGDAYIFSTFIIIRKRSVSMILTFAAELLSKLNTSFVSITGLTDRTIPMSI